MLSKFRVLLAALVILSVSPAGAQDVLRAVTGTVTDRRGNALPGAAVQLENTVTLAVRSYLAGKEGEFHFNGVGDDVDYTLRARYATHWSDTKTISKFRSGAHVEVKLVVPID